MAHSAIMSVRITGNSDDAVKAFSKVTGKAAARLPHDFRAEARTHFIYDLEETT